MTFARFCEYLSKIEATSKRLEMTDLVARLINESSSDDVDKIVYLSLGQMAPLYADIDFGIADKMMIRAISLAFDVPESAVRSSYKYRGDMGTTAQELREKFSGEKRRQREYHMNTLFDLFLKIAHETGEGSQERKLNLVADLLRSLTPIESKYAVRILLKTLRLGFSDKTVLDALSLLVAGDKSAREQFEAMYNVRPDIGWLAKEVKRVPKSQAFQSVKPKLGIPILPALCQRLPSTEEIIEKMGRVAVEPKWDGERIQAHAWIQRTRAEGQGLKENHITVSIKLFTRSLEDVTEMFPDLVSSLKKLMELPSSFGPHPLALILDGEIIGIDPKTGKIISFQSMMTRKRKYGVAAQLLSVPIRYMIFDMLFMNGKSLLSEPFSTRRKALASLFSAQAPGVRPEDSVPSTVKSSGLNSPRGTSHQQLTLAPQLITDNPRDIRSFLKNQLDAGLEGIVAKKLDAPYSPGRTGFTWVKLKWEGDAKGGGLLDTIDCVVMGTYAGRGKRSGFGVGAFLVGVRDGTSGNFQTVSKIGTGLSDEQWKELKAKGQGLRAKGQPKEYDVPKQLVPDVWLRPELVVEIQADNITKSPLHTAGYALRFPRLVRYRMDKKPEQATTLTEIKRLFRLQNGS